MSPMTDFQKANWRRIDDASMPVYLHTLEPDWFVPNRSGDGILKNLSRHIRVNGDPAVTRFLNRLPASRPFVYPGREACLTLEHLRELWFHITNRCNLSCTHCLFSSSPQARGELAAENVLQVAAEAYRLGCRLFALTGGEPFMHPDIDTIIRGLLALKESHVVVLTNGMTLPPALNRRRFDRERFHLQVSVDGIDDRHDAVRGRGAFARLSENLLWLKNRRWPYTVSMSVSRHNVADMPAVVDYGAGAGAGNIHYLWHFVRGRGQSRAFAPLDDIFSNLQAARIRAAARGIKIDNIASLRTQVFAPRGTIHDGTTAAWESLAMGPDRRLYPSAALIGIDALASDMNAGIESAWRESPVLKRIRRATAATLDTPFRYLLGGGDIDHSYIYGKTFIGADPYLPLYEKMALALITEEARRQPRDGSPRLRLRMGEILESCGAHGRVALLHSNCLLATARQDSLTIVKSYYNEAAGDRKEEILNPVCYAEALIDHIPEAYRFRGYGCGSPVMDADIRPGLHVLDLGCGSGVECFVASRLCGRNGRVTGVDMLDPMLALAGRGRVEVARKLGYDNIEFRKGYLEYLPLCSESVDVAISNCVMNLSVHKRRAYNEIYRVLKPGGRLVISDVVCETEPDPAIRNDERLRGECIAGAMTQNHLMALLEETGFKGIVMIRRFPYRVIQGHPFFSLTYSALKPKESEQVRVIYRGPLTNIVTLSGTLLPQGLVRQIPRYEADLLGDQIFVLDGNGAVTNIDAENGCACHVSPEAKGARKPDGAGMNVSGERLPAGCMVCGQALVYHSESRPCRCVYCAKPFSANAVCVNGHYVCDACHGADGLQVIRHICLHTDECDMIRLLERIRSHPAVPVNGPEHHALVPGIVLATYRNRGGEISDSIIENGIQRGSSVAGGYCAFMGVCGAAVGVGIAFSLILGANPLTPGRRKRVQSATGAVLAEIAKFKAARCCQRDSWVALKKAARLSTDYLPLSLTAGGDLRCRQKEKNRECLGRSCPLY